MPVSGSIPVTPRSSSHAASVSWGSAQTMSRIICHAATLKAPCGAGPMASETEHWGQKLTRRADDFCRGLSPTVCANTYIAMHLCRQSSSRLQRRQYRFSNKALSVKRTVLSRLRAHLAIHKYAERFRTMLASDYSRGSLPSTTSRSLQGAADCY